jgi:hypothetical protein
MAGIALVVGAGVITQATSAYAEETPQTRAYRYVYYPAKQVYYATEQQIWFWMNGNSWNFGVHLPKHYRMHQSIGVPIMLQTRRPYVQHVYVEQRYGRPWREQHSNKQDAHHAN